MKMLIFLFSFFICALFVAQAAPVSQDEAEMAAQAWSVRGETLGAQMGERIENSAVHETETGAKFYTVKMKGDAGGTVIMTSDDELEPVLAFIEGDADFTTIDRESPLWAVLDRHVSAMGESLGAKFHSTTTTSSYNSSGASSRWKTLIAEGEEIRRNGLPKMGTRVGDKAIGDMRVPTLCKTKWSQGGGIYNYYTPYHRVCGCVATAQSQIMRKHCWPTKSITKRTRTCKVSGVETNLTTIGGTFDWANMPYSDIAEEYQKQAIGKLTSDVGICQKASYGSSGTGAYTSDIRYTLRNDFNYGAAVYAGYPCTAFDNASTRAAAMQRIFFANFDAGLPIAVGVKNHEIVADGYGYVDGVDYVHFNFGWGGSDNAWYHIPDLTAASSSYSYIDDLVYNIMPTNGMKEAVMSGRVLAKAGYPIRGATVKVKGEDGKYVASTTTSEYGVWSFVLSAGASSTPKEYDVVVEAAGNYKAGEKTGIALTYPDSYSLTCDTLSDTKKLGNCWGNDITVEMVNTDYPEVPNTGATFENHAVGDTRVIDEDDNGGLAKETYLGKFWWGPDAGGEVHICSEIIPHAESSISEQNMHFASFTGMVYRTIHNAYDVTNSPAASAADFVTEEIGSEGFVFDAFVRLQDAQDIQDGQDVALPDDDVKIAVVAKNGKLVVIAGDGVSDHSTKVYETGKIIDTSKMHRLTLRCQPQPSTSTFRVWVDGRVIGDYPSRILEGENAGRVRAMGFLGTDTWVDDVFFSREVPPFILPGMLFIIR